MYLFSFSFYFYFYFYFFFQFYLTFLSLILILIIILKLFVYLWYYPLIQRFPFISLFMLLRRTPKTGVETSNTCVILDGFSINIWLATSSAVDVLHLGLETILILSVKGIVAIFSIIYKCFLLMASTCKSVMFDFELCYRVFPETFQLILMFVRPTLNAINAYGRKQISPETQLLITLWFIATPDSYRHVFYYFSFFFFLFSAKD